MDPQQPVEAPGAPETLEPTRDAPLPWAPRIALVAAVVAVVAAATRFCDAAVAR